MANSRSKVLRDSEWVTSSPVSVPKYQDALMQEHTFVIFCASLRNDISRAQLMLRGKSAKGNIANMLTCAERARVSIEH